MRTPRLCSSITSRMGLFLLWFVAMMAPAGAAADYASPGPYPVGMRTFSIAGPSGTTSNPLVVWYPAASPPAGSGDGEMGAPAAAGPFPLIVAIHGLGAKGEMLAPLARRFASHGFVVASADYDDNRSSDGDQRAVILLHDRPAEVVRVIEFMDFLTVSRASLAGVVDTARIGVWGLSTGGTTAFQAAGAQLDLRGMDAWCADNGANSDALETCQFVGHEHVIAENYEAADPSAALLPPIWDKRVAAVVATSPGGELHAFGDKGIAAVKAPVLVMFAADDREVLPEFNALWAYDGIASKNKALAKFDHGGHALFMDPKSPHFDEATGLATAFFVANLKGRAAESAMLAKNAVTIPGLDYRTTIR